jgi:hypothetical protein
MSAKLSKSQLGLILISVVILLYSIIYVKNDKWLFDFYYFIHLFNLFIAIDFIFYIIFCSHLKGKTHYVFCTFPLTRFQVLYLELKYYLSRWEFKLFILSILVFISIFFLINNHSFIELTILLILYLVQITYIITILFVLKNLIKNKNINSDLKNLLSIYISLMILIVILSDKNQFFKIILCINPISNGFIAYLMGIQLGMWGVFLSIFVAIILIIIAKNKFKIWDLY